MGKTWIETSPNATRRRFVAMSASSMCSERWAGRGADGVTRRGFGFLAQLLMSRATLSRGIDRTRARPQFRNPEGLIAQDFVTSPQGVLALAGRAARSSEPSIKW